MRIFRTVLDFALLQLCCDFNMTRVWNISVVTAWQGRSAHSHLCLHSFNLFPSNMRWRLVLQKWESWSQSRSCTNSTLTPISKLEKPLPRGQVESEGQRCLLIYFSTHLLLYTSDSALAGNLYIPGKRKAAEEGSLEIGIDIPNIDVSAEKVEIYIL